MSKEKAELKSRVVWDSREFWISSFTVHNKVISSFQLSFHDGFGVIDWIFMLGLNIKESHDNNVSSSESGWFGL